MLGGIHKLATQAIVLAADGVRGRSSLPLRSSARLADSVLMHAVVSSASREPLSAGASLEGPPEPAMIAAQNECACHPCPMLLFTHPIRADPSPPPSHVKKPLPGAAARARALAGDAAAASSGGWRDHYRPALPAARTSAGHSCALWSHESAAWHLSLKQALTVLSALYGSSAAPQALHVLSRARFSPPPPAGCKRKLP